MAGLIERTLLRLAPRLALGRLESRVRYDMLQRAYDAAKPSRKTKEWKAPGSSAAAEDAPALATLRNRSRDIMRNNPWGKKAKRQLPAHLVGTGVVPRPTDADAKKCERALAVWNAWAEEADTEGGTGFDGLQHLTVQTVVEAGEGFILWDPSPASAGGWGVRVLEPDYLDETFHEDSRNGSGRIVSGVEFDAAGRRAAYHFFRHHPGDMMPMMRRLGERVRVPAEFVDHVYERVRPGQVRGIPWMSASMLGIRDMADYTDAERWRKKITAAMAAFVTSTGGPANSPLGATSTSTDGNGRQTVMQRILPGTIKHLAPGEDVKFSAPPADQGLEPYLRWEMFAICAGIGIPYAEFTGDLSNANYGSMRAGKVEFWALLDTWQWLMCRPMMLAPAWRRVQAARGVPGIACDWGFPKRMWVDPLKDVSAEILAARAGLDDTPSQIGARGYDWREKLESQAAYLAKARELGLVLDVDAASLSKAGVTNARPDGTSVPATDPADAARAAIVETLTAALAAD